MENSLDGYCYYIIKLKWLKAYSYLVPVFPVLLD